MESNDKTLEYLQVLKNALETRDISYNVKENRFFLSILNKQYEVTEYLVSVGVNPRVMKDVALKIACFTGCVKTVKFLLDCGADKKTYNGAPLKIAIENGHEEVIKLLKNK